MNCLKRGGECAYDREKRTGYPLVSYSVGEALAVLLTLRGPFPSLDYVACGAPVARDAPGILPRILAISRIVLAQFYAAIPMAALLLALSYSPDSGAEALRATRMAWQSRASDHARKVLNGALRASWVLPWTC
jgi:hypothetical protein